MSGLETFDVCRWYDPQLTAHNPGEVLGKYANDRDMTALAIPAGATPMVFTCRLLGRKHRRMVRLQPCDEDRWSMAFRFGVSAIRNLPGRTGVIEARRSRPDEPLTDDVMDELGITENMEQEIGMVVWEKSRLDPDVPLSCPQLDFSLRAYGAVAYRHAEQKKASLTQAGGDSEG